MDNIVPITKNLLIIFVPNQNFFIFVKDLKYFSFPSSIIKKELIQNIAVIRKEKLAAVTVVKVVIIPWVCQYLTHK
ncbi:MAG: hypothetical protein LBD41_06405 [Clostridiales Family XIII bacterium]|nr:hypothetical protein [Clostridiales Family XIII bacterium]